MYIGEMEEVDDGCTHVFHKMFRINHITLYVLYEASGHNNSVIPGQSS